MKEETKQKLKQLLKEWLTVIFILIPVQFILIVLMANFIEGCTDGWFYALVHMLFILLIWLCGIFTLSLLIPKVRVVACKPIIKGISCLYNKVIQNSNYIFVFIITVALFLWCLGDIFVISDDARNSIQTSFCTGILIAKLLTALFICQCWKIIKNK